MNSRPLCFALVTLAALTPLTSNASPEKDSINACAHAFAARLSADAVRPLAFKVNYPDHVNATSGSIADSFSMGYSFDLQARDPKTGAVVERARCSTNLRGAVTALRLTPLDNDSTLSAQL
jgi:hypothetical protein